MTNTTVRMPVYARVGDAPEFQIATVEVDDPNEVRPALAAALRSAADYLEAKDTDE